MSFKSGFSLIELIIVIAIFAVLSSDIIFRFKGFFDNYVTESSIYELYSNITSFQSSVSATFNNENNPDNCPYGIYFKKETGSNNNDYYRYFLDNSSTPDTSSDVIETNACKNDDGVFIDGTNVSSFYVPKGSSISLISPEFSIYDGNSDEKIFFNKIKLSQICIFDSGTVKSVDNLSLVFIRSKTDININYQDGTMIKRNQKKAVISLELKENTSKKFYIIINRNGIVDITDTFNEVCA